jgi:hypothetical protein
MAGQRYECRGLAAAWGNPAAKPQSTGAGGPAVHKSSICCRRRAWTLACVQSAWARACPAGATQ